MSNIEILNKDLLNARIEIFISSHKKSHHIPESIIKDCTWQLLMFLNQQIGAYTIVNYKITPITHDLKIKIPINVYTDEDTKLSALELGNKRREIIKTYIENYDFNTAAPIIQFIVRNLSTWVDNNLWLKIIIPIINYENIEQLKVNFNITAQIKMRKDEFSDGSKILYYVDPLLTNYGLFHDLTVSYNEMSFGYNYLHLFEHMMTKAWVGITYEDTTTYNGFTYPNGVCCIYHCQNSLNDHLKISKATIDWIIESRKNDFWKLNEELIKETTRTISETSDERTLSSMGRSDPYAYKFKYDTSVFDYWCNKPFSLLIVGKSEKIIYDKDKIAQMIYNNPLRTVDIPKSITIHHIPREVLLFKSQGSFVVKKASDDDVKNGFISQNFKGFYGKDNVMVNASNPNCSYKDLNSLCHVLLFNQNLFTNKEIRYIIDNLIIPREVDTWCLRPIVLNEVKTK
jgi:hypothetical protein